MSYLTKTMVISAITNITLSIMKVVTGILGKSGALVADGVHSLSDLITDGVAVIGGKISNKPADDKHPYGHGNLEYLTSIGIGAVVLVLGLSLIKEATVTEIAVPNLILCVVSLFTIISKYALAKYIIKRGKIHKNSILVASGKESMMDAVSSLFVLVSIILMQFSDKITFLRYADMIASIIIGLFIVKTGFSIISENISTILGEKYDEPKYTNNVTDILIGNRLVEKVDNLIIIKYGPYYRLTVDIGMSPKIKLAEVYKVVKNLEKAIKRKDKRIKYININVKPYEGE